MDPNSTSQDIKKLFIWPNGKKASKCVQIEINANLNSLKRLKETISYEMKFQKISLDRMKLFNYKGIEIDDTDINFLANNQILYLSIDSYYFNVLNHVNEYEFVKWIKAGGYGKVYLARHTLHGDLVAIKRIDVHNFSSDELYNISRESVYLESFRHRNIIKCLNSYTYEDVFYLVMEYAKGGELFSILTQGVLPEAQAKNIFKQLHEAVKYIHSRNVIHRDLKPNNILFLDEERTQVVLIDFGISGFYNGYAKESIKAGTIRYVPPEIASGEAYDSSPKLDIWAMGVILYLMCFGKFPFDALKEADIAQKICNQAVIYPKNIRVSKTCYNVINGMLQKNHALRIESGDKLFDDWYNDNECDILTQVASIPKSSESTNSLLPSNDKQRLSRFTPIAQSPPNSVNTPLPIINVENRQSKTKRRYTTMPPKVVSKSPDPRIKVPLYQKVTASSLKNNMKITSSGTQDRNGKANKSSSNILNVKLKSSSKKSILKVDKK